MSYLEPINMHFNKFYILALILCNMLFISCKKTDNKQDSDGSSRPLTIAQIKDQNSLFDYVKGKADKDDLIDSAWKQFNSLEKPIGAAEFRDKLIKESSLPKYAITEDSRPGLYLLDKITSSIGIED